MKHMNRNPIDIINEDLSLDVGVGATYYSGSDAYPYYVSELLPNGVIGLYSPKSWFDDKHPMYFGSLVVAPFNPKTPSSIYIKRLYGHWWRCEKNGKRIQRWHSISFGHAESYLDIGFD